MTEEIEFFTVCLTMTVGAKDDMQAIEIVRNHAKKEPWRLSARATESVAERNHPILFTEKYGFVSDAVNAMLERMPTITLSEEAWENLALCMYQGFSMDSAEIVIKAFAEHLCTPEQQAVLDAADVTISDLLDDFSMGALPEPERSAIVADWNKKLGLRYWEISHDDD